MPELIYVEPSQATMSPITPDQYSNIVDLLQSNEEATNLILNENSGNVSIEGVEFTWAFDGIDELRVYITKVHSFKAKLYGNENIFKMLGEKLQAAL
jgi:hypothetical protein